MEPVARKTSSPSRSSRDMSSSLSEEEDAGQSQSSDNSSSPSDSGDQSDSQTSQSHSPDPQIEGPSTSTSEDGEPPEMKTTVKNKAPAQPTQIEGTMSQRKDLVQGLPNVSLRVSKKVDDVEVQPKDSSSALPHSPIEDCIGSDRKEDFDRSSSSGRAAARHKAEDGTLDGRQCSEAHVHPKAAQGSVINDDKADLTSEGMEQTKFEPNISGYSSERTQIEEMTKPAPRVQASWLNEAFSACKANKKNSLKEGDLLIILDPNDYSKSCLVDSLDFCKASEPLAQLFSLSSAGSQGCASQGLSGLVIFSVTASTPQLYPMPLDCSASDITKTLKPAQGLGAHHEKIEEVKIKVELDRKTADSAALDPKTLFGKKSTDLDTDWPKACDSLLRSILTRQRAHGVSRKDFAAALPQIEGIVSVAQKYGLAREVQSDFDGLFLGYVGSGKFWELIAQLPVRCLKIGIALKNLPVYQEAFKHLVGISANSKAGKTFEGLPDDVQAIIQRRARELYNWRRDLNEDLLLISLTAKKETKPESPQEFPSTTVSQHNQPDAYSTVNVVRDWMAEHIGYLRGDTSRVPSPHYLCDHKSGCNTVAGFYRSIAAGGEAYLHIENVWETFNESFLLDPEEGELDWDVVRLPLLALKAKASECVSGLVKSTLHLPGKDDLDYLTCVAVGPEDVPWDVGGKDGESEDSDGD